MSCPDCATAFDQGYRMGERDYSDLLAAAEGVMGDELDLEERDRLRAALRQVTRRRTSWLSIGAINNVAEIRVERELFEEWLVLASEALEGRDD